MSDSVEIVGDIVSLVLEEDDSETLQQVKLLLDNHIWLRALAEPAEPARFGRCLRQPPRSK